MFLEFMTARNTCGHRKYLCFDTEKKVFSRHHSRMIYGDYVIEIKTKHYNMLIKDLERESFKEVDNI